MALTFSSHLDNLLQCLDDTFTSKNADFPYNSYKQVNLDAMNAADCKEEFHVKKQDLPLPAEALQLWAIFKCEQRNDVEELCILLKRLSYPCLLSDLILRFARPVSVRSLITSYVLNYIFDVHTHWITPWDQDTLNPVALQPPDVIYSKGAALDNCFGFINGTVWSISTPGEHERIVYNRHKWIHVFKFQSSALPNGLFTPISGT